MKQMRGIALGFTLCALVGGCAERSEFARGKRGGLTGANVLGAKRCDVVIGRPTECGSVHVYSVGRYGLPRAPSVAVSAPRVPSAPGTCLIPHWPTTLVSTGDVTGDSHDDVLCTFSGDASVRDRLWIVAGGTAPLGAPTSQVLPLPSGEGIDATRDFAGFGRSAATLYFDADNVLDLAVGGDRIVVVYRSSLRQDGTRVFDTVLTWVLPTAEQSSKFNVFAEFLANAGDVDGDGDDELAISHESPDGQTGGLSPVEVLFGVEGTTTRRLDVPIPVQIASDASAIRSFGHKVAGGLRVGGGRGTCLAIGAPEAEIGGSTRRRGGVWVYTFAANEFVAYSRLCAARGEASRAGYFAANLGDIDGDGLDDLAVSAFTDDAIANPNDPFTRRGEVLLYSSVDLADVSSKFPATATAGRPATAVVQFPVVTRDNDPSLLVRAAATGDVNGDGRADVVIVSPGYGDVSGGNSPTRFGAGYLLLGARSFPTGDIAPTARLLDPLEIAHGGHPQTAFGGVVFDPPIHRR